MMPKNTSGDRLQLDMTERRFSKQIPEFYFKLVGFQRFLLVFPAFA